VTKNTQEIQQLYNFVESIQIQPDIEKLTILQRVKRFWIIRNWRKRC